MLLGLVLLCSFVAVQLDGEQWRQFALRFRRMLAIHDLSMKEIAYALGLDPAMLSRALDGAAQFDLRRLYQPSVNPEWLRTLNWLELEYFGPPTWVERAVKLAEAVKKEQVA